MWMVLQARCSDVRGITAGLTRQHPAQQPRGAQAAALLDLQALATSAMLTAVSTT